MAASFSENSASTLEIWDIMSHEWVAKCLWGVQFTESPWGTLLGAGWADDPLTSVYKCWGLVGLIWNSFTPITIPTNKAVFHHLMEKLGSPVIFHKQWEPYILIIRHFQMLFVIVYVEVHSVASDWHLCAYLLHVIVPVVPVYVFYAFKDCIFEVNSLLPGPSLEFSKLLFGAFIPTSAAFLLEGPNFSKFSL